MPPQNALRKRLSKHLLEEGFLLHSGPANIESRLRKLMGSVRYEMYLDACDSARSGESGTAEIYRCVQNKEEAHALFSHQVKTIAVVDERLAAEVLKLEHPPLNIADLGCCTGAFCRWLKNELPATHVVGFEREKNLLDIAINNSNGPTFHHWDYSSGQKPPVSGFEILVTGMGIDFAHADHHYPLGLVSRRDLEGYKACFQQAMPIFENWRSISCEGAKLFAVLRIPSASSFLAVVDAAARVGWSIQLDDCSWINTLDGERFPCLVFNAVDAQSILVDEDVMVGHWLADEIRLIGATEIKNDAARELYKHIHPKTILTTKEESYDDGHVRRWHIVSCGSFSLEYSEATTGAAELKFLPQQR